MFKKFIERIDAVIIDIADGKVREEEKDLRIKELEKELADRDIKIAGLDAVVEEKDVEIEVLKLDVEERDARIAELEEASVKYEDVKELEDAIGRLEAMFAKEAEEDVVEEIVEDEVVEEEVIEEVVEVEEKDDEIEE